MKIEWASVRSVEVEPPLSDAMALEKGTSHPKLRLNKNTP